MPPVPPDPILDYVRAVRLYRLHIRPCIRVGKQTITEYDRPQKG